MQRRGGGRPDVGGGGGGLRRGRACLPVRCSPCRLVPVERSGVIGMLESAIVRFLVQGRGWHGG